MDLMEDEAGNRRSPTAEKLIPSIFTVASRQ
jgi:hypothetical protein